MRYNKRYAINIFTKGDCYIYDFKESKTVGGKLFGSVADARRYLRNTLNQRPCKVAE